MFDRVRNSSKRLQPSATIFARWATSLVSRWRLRAFGDFTRFWASSQLQANKLLGQMFDRVRNCPSSQTTRVLIGLSSQLFPNTTSSGRDMFESSQLQAPIQEATLQAASRSGKCLIVRNSYKRPSSQPTRVLIGLSSQLFPSTTSSGRDMFESSQLSKLPSKKLHYKLRVDRANV